MTVSSNGRRTSTRQRRAKTGAETSSKLENIKGESMSTDNSVNADNKAVKVEPAKKEVTGTLALPGQRPITSSDLQVVETMNIMGIRPITANKMQVTDTINLSGIRPIAKSDLVVSETYSVMGNRPVASNEIDDSFSLMGFLD
ncbi:hypothetical protein Riv7116_0397 [Rivularia sp. PCC 7116]|uniref:hypothetical protein n=1 Tax=Rivularia sp. PCC 7116 TaxID=373994 RepID=UPI00029EE024|nr:hypothetical protein [Rivularia sp. PCC 7116]AFY53001.1 hypothetical protein Riv7116_0397 [Rivularia sp. PCC 7116]